MQKNVIHRFTIYLIILLFFSAKIKAESADNTSFVTQKYEIHIVLEGEGLKTIYCDDNIEIFGTENINFYIVNEENNKININSLVGKYFEDNHYCQYLVRYNVIKPIEKIIIEISGSPKKLKQLFANSEISRLERFDYPFPENENDFQGMFYNSTLLKYVNLINFKFSQAKDISKMFYNCSNLEEIIFPVGDTDNIEDFSDFIAFSTKIEKVDLSTFAFTGAKNLGYMFNSCTNLKEIIFPKKKAENIEILSEMFSLCQNLISLDLSYFSFKKIRNFAYAFNGCRNLAYIKFPENEKATDVRNIKYMFAGCNKLTSIDLSGFSFVNIIDIASMFSECFALEKLILPQNEMASNIQDFSYMLRGCMKLTEIDLSNIDFANSKKLSYMFYECKSLKSINLYTSVKATRIENIQGMFIHCEKLASIDLSNFSFTKTKDLTSMFFYCSNLETIILPKNELATSVENLSYMFSTCLKLKIIDLSGISFTSVVDLRYLFSNCLSLENIIFPEDVETSNNIQHFSYVFANCYKLTTIDISKFNLDNVQDINYLFFSCSNLENIALPNRKFNNIINMGYTFSNCSKMETIDITWINMSNVLNLDNTFSNCKKLNKIKFTEDEKIKKINDMNNTFANCTSLISLNLSHIYVDTNINLNHSIYNCHSLKELNIWNIDISKSDLTHKFLYNVTLDGCLYHSYDNVNSGDSITNKKCSKYIGFQKCGPCINNNEEEFCSMNIDGENFNFYYLDYELNLPVEERKCYWSYNYENAIGLLFVDNSNNNQISYYVDYCDHFCDECSENRFGCIKCKNNLYPTEIELNEYKSNIKSFFFCYNSNDMKNYYLNLESEIFIKCAEKCSECPNGVDLCSKCNNEKGFFKVEGIENECWKDNPEDNWIFNETDQEWHKCNDRCKNCSRQSKSNNEHYCLKCADNYYAYYTDYLNLVKGILNYLNCYSMEEVKSENKNYYVNGNYLEKCDDSCSECEVNNNKCIKCQTNYYPIYEHINGTCFHYPLAHYSVTQIDGESVYLPCFHLCKYCHQISHSFFYQQCSECDEIKYTLDFYSLNQSYCIPLIKYNITYFIKEGKKWYISNFEGMEKFMITNKQYTIDYQRLLQGEKYKNFQYIIADECPSDKPYIIFTTKQCVSSCSSPNLLEFGIFMTKKLYLYKNICYNECPHGSIIDKENNTCKEINEYTKNVSLTMKEYTISQKDNILRYLGDEYARDTIQFIRGDEFSAYDLKAQKMDDIEKMKDYKIPIYLFPECLEELRKTLSLNDSENIYIEIIEKNNEKSGFNSTNFKFFTDSGNLLDHSCCYNLNMIVMKHIYTNKIGINSSVFEMFNYLLNNSIGISDDKFLDHCEPIIVNDTDLTLIDRRFLSDKAKKLCDNNCQFLNFDFNKNYSVCICKIEEEGSSIAEELEKQFQDLELIEKLNELFNQEGNWKYFYCYKIITLPIMKKNWIIYIQISFLIADIMLFIYYLWKIYSIIKNIYINILKNINRNSNQLGGIISNNEDNENEYTISIEDIENDNEITEDFFEARNEGINFWKTFYKYIKQKIIPAIFFIKTNHLEQTIFKIIKIIIFIDNFFYISTFLFTEKYISSIKFWYEKKYEYSFTSEFHRIVLIIIICYVINSIIFFFFNGLNILKEAINYYKKGTINRRQFKKRINYLKRSSISKFTIGFISVIILHHIYLYFFLIFGTIFYNSQKYFLIFFIFSQLGYLLIYTFIILIVMILRWISLKFNYQVLQYVFKLSIFIADFL